MTHQCPDCNKFMAKGDFAHTYTCSECGTTQLCCVSCGELVEFDESEGDADGLCEECRDERCRELAEAKFDWKAAGIDEAGAWVIVDSANQIRWLSKQTAANILEIGKCLTKVKEALPHGQWGGWLEVEFGWSDRHARRFMAAYDAFGKPKIDKYGKLPDNFKTDKLAEFIAPSALYELAAPSMPQAARDEAIERAEAGEHVTHTAAKAIARKHKDDTSGAQPKAPAAPTKISKAAILAYTQEMSEDSKVGTYTNAQGFVQRYMIPAKNDPRVDVAWLRHAPIEEVRVWMRKTLGDARWDQITGKAQPPTIDLQADGPKSVN